MATSHGYEAVSRSIVWRLALPLDPSFASSYMLKRQCDRINWRRRSERAVTFRGRSKCFVLVSNFIGTMTIIVPCCRADKIFNNFQWYIDFWMVSVEIVLWISVCLKNDLLVKGAFTYLSRILLISLLQCLCYVNDRQERSQFANIYEATITTNNSETNREDSPPNIVSPFCHYREPPMHVVLSYKYNPCTPLREIIFVPIVVRPIILTYAICQPLYIRIYVCTRFCAHIACM